MESNNRGTAKIALSPKRFQAVDSVSVVLPPGVLQHALHSMMRSQPAASTAARISPGIKFVRLIGETDSVLEAKLTEASPTPTNLPT